MTPIRVRRRMLRLGLGRVSPMVHPRGGRQQHHAAVQLFAYGTFEDDKVAASVPCGGSAVIAHVSAVPVVCQELSET